MQKQKPTNCDLCGKKLKGKEVNMGTCEPCLLRQFGATPGTKEGAKVDKDKSKWDEFVEGMIQSITFWP